MIHIDRHTIIQVLGCLMKKPGLLNDVDKYRLEVSDFPNTLDKIVFTAINNLYNSGDGAEIIRTVDIVNYLKENPACSGTLEKENGEAFLTDCEVQSEISNFYYYYNRLKKFNLLNDISRDSGRDVSMFYCEDILNPKLKEINDRFDKMTPADIINQIKLENNAYEARYVFNKQIIETTPANGIRQLVKELKEQPEVGCKLQGDIFNSICRGGRKGKLYLRSAGSGVGKTRQMVGDACSIAYPIRFDRNKNKWVSTGSCEKVLYIMTEQDPEEINTMILAYLTGYNEEIFVYGTYGEKEMPRIEQAIQIIEEYKDNLLMVKIDDPCSSVIKNVFRKYAIQFGVENFFYDYIFSSPALLNEYRDLKIREDVALRLLTTTLKNLAYELSAFVMTSTQVTENDDGKTKGGFKDHRNVQGSHAIPNLVDFGCIMSRPTEEELQQLQGVMQFMTIPNLVIDVYKNRRGRWTQVRIWCKNDLGCCRREDLFITTANMKQIDDFRVFDFNNINFKDFQDICDKYNGEMLTSDYTEDVVEFETADIQPNELLVDAASAFEELGTKRFDDKTFDDFLF